MENKHELELEQANHFMKWITTGNFKLLEKPELQRPSRKGGQPDFRFEDGAGQEYVLELTRLLNKKLKRLEKFVRDNICASVKGQLPGTYTLEIPVDLIGRGWIEPEIAKQTIAEISALLKSGTLGEVQQLGTGFVLCKVRDDGNRLAHWLTAKTLPPELALDDTIARELEKEFHKIVQSADKKFKGYTGTRILLIGLSQSGLDWEFHAQRFKDSQGIMLVWADNEGKTLVNVDHIYLEPGISVWQPEPSVSGTQWGCKVFAGHRYTNSKAGHYVLLWQRPGTPTLLR